jgi:hypothetical protein
MQTQTKSHFVCFIVGTCYNMPRSGRTSLLTIATKSRRHHLKQIQDQLLLKHVKVAMLMKRMAQVTLHQQNVADQMVKRRRNKGEVKIL